MPQSRSAEIADIEQKLQEIDVFLRRAPWGLAALVLVIPAGLLLGSTAAWLTVLGVVTITGVAMYIPAVHRYEHRRRLAELEQQQG